MSWLDRRRQKRAAEAVDHPAPVEIDLGIHRVLDVQLAVERMKGDGLNVFLYTQDQTVQVAHLAPQRCHVLVGTEDEARVRAELLAANLILPGDS